MPDESGGGCKVDRVSQKYGLDTIDEVLKDLQKEGTSLRDLETQYNQRVLESALREEGVDVLKGEVENLYRLFMGDNVSAGMRIEARSRLEQHGTDPESIRDDFVSYQTIRTHLRECLAVNTERESTVTTNGAKNTVFKLLSRTESVTKRTIERLCSSGYLHVGAVDVTLSLRIACTDCGEEYTLSRLVERGRCSCTVEKQSTKK